MLALLGHGPWHFHTVRLFSFSFVCSYYFYYLVSATPLAKYLESLQMSQSYENVSCFYSFSVDYINGYILSYEYVYVYTYTLTHKLTLVN